MNMLCDTLEKNHYNLYANVSEEEFQAEREKIARQTAKMTDEEFYWSVCHLVSLIGDAHTMVGNTGEPFMTALLWSIKKFDDGWYILKLDQRNEQYLGMRVTAINDLPIDEAVERTRQVISYETDSWFWNLVPQTLAWRGALEYLEIVKDQLLPIDDKTLDFQKWNQIVMIGSGQIGSSHDFRKKQEVTQKQQISSEQNPSKT